MCTCPDQLQVVRCSASLKPTNAALVLQHMLATGDFTMKTETGETITAPSTAGANTADGRLQNNYVRPSGCQVRMLHGICHACAHAAVSQLMQLDSCMQ